MELYNSLGNKLEVFEPLNSKKVTMYVCGPTVYAFPTIGNFRTYVTADFLYRTLVLLGYPVCYVMNLTDVGHLTGDTFGNTDHGDDKLEKAAEKEGRKATEIADFYIADFMQSLDKLAILRPTKFARATEYIMQQLGLIKTLEKKGFTYEISDGLYFDTSKYAQYGALSGFTAESIVEGARLEPNPEKRNPTDFALWKLSPKDVQRWQEWDSPWGVGFPGWHLECSAMAMYELGDTIDLHLGGEDLKMIHHQNELAQSECATGKRFVKYWLHGAFLLVDHGRMSKSLGNAFTLQDIVAKGFDPLSLRYLYLTVHYRTQLDFTFEDLQRAQDALKHLYDIVGSYRPDNEPKVSDKHLVRFKEKLAKDLNLPDAVACMWDMLKSNIPESQKLYTVMKMDEILGLGLDEHIGLVVPQNILDLARTRSAYKKSGIWDKAGMIKKQIADLGYIVEDINNDFKVRRRL